MPDNESLALLEELRALLDDVRVEHFTKRSAFGDTVHFSRQVLPGLTASQLADLQHRLDQAIRRAS